MKKTIFYSLSFILMACSSTQNVSTSKEKISLKNPLKNSQTFLLTEVSTDPTYGLNQKNPVAVGGVDQNEGPQNERRFLNALAGPNGEKVTYFRAGSCCPIKSDSAPFGMAMLDNYRVTWENSKDTVSIFINMYDSAVLKAPMGFTIKE
jgi:hypothetical protein